MTNNTENTINCITILCYSSTLTMELFTDIMPTDQALPRVFLFPVIKFTGKFSIKKIFYLAGLPPPLPTPNFFYLPIFYIEKLRVLYAKNTHG